MSCEIGSDAVRLEVGTRLPTKLMADWGGGVSGRPQIVSLRASDLLYSERLSALFLEKIRSGL